MKEKSFTIKEIAEMTGAKIIGDPNYLIHGVADLASATAHQLSFLSNPRYHQEMLKSKAGVILLENEEGISPEKNFLISNDPSLAFQKVVEAFYQQRMKEKTGFNGIHGSAVIHETAKIGKNVTIGPNAVIEKDVVIDEGTTIGAGSYIGLGVKIGSECTIYQNVVVREYCVLGNRVILQPGVVIGSCGFGYITDKQGKHIKLNQLGIVVLEDDVEVGANTTIDRARYQTTHIHKGTKIDNLVQIAHGVSLGEDNIIVAQTGIAGSTQTGRHVLIGGQAAIDGHLSITDGVMLAARSGVSKSLRKAGKYGGSPCFDLEDYNRNNVHLRSIEKHINKIKDLESRLAALEADKAKD